jgi:hypothetical protein
MESSVGPEVTHRVQAASAWGRACPSPDRRRVRRSLRRRCVSSRRGGEGGNHRRATTLATYEILR